MGSNNTEFTDDVFDALLCYVFNMYPEIPKLCKMLGKVVRQMVKGHTIGEMRFRIKNIVPSIKSFLESWNDLLPPSKFTPVDVSLYQADPLEPFPARLHNWTDQIQYLWADSSEMYGEEHVGAPACKRRRHCFSK